VLVARRRARACGAPARARTIDPSARAVPR
jgi:hypothetical protein